MAVVQSPMSFEPEKPENLEKFYQYLTKETHEKIISQTKQTFSLFIPGDIISSTCTRWSGLGSANVKKISHDIYVLLNLMAKVVSLDGMGECGGHVRAKVGFTKHHLFLPNGSPKVYICAETVFEINSKRIAGYRMWWFVIDQTWSLSDGITKVMNSNIRSLDVPSKKYGKNPVNQMYDEWKNLTSPQHLTALMQSIINQCPIDTDTLNAEDSNPVEDMDFSQIINPIHASCNLNSFVPDPIQASIENYFEPYNESPAIFTGFPKIENVLLIPITNMNPINFSGAPLPRIMIDIPDYHLYLKHDARVETLRADQFQAILNVVNYYIARSGLRLEEDSPEDFNVLLQYRRVNETVHKGKIEQSKQTKDGGKALQNWRFHASESLASILTQYCRSAIPKLTKSVAGNWSWFLDLPNNQKYIGPKRLVFQDLPPIGNFVLALQETNRTICRIKGQESVGILLDLVMNAAYEYTGDTTRTKVGKPLIRLLGPPGCGKSAALSALQQVSAPYSSDRVSTQTAKWWTTDGDHSDVLTMVDEGESNAKTDPEGFRARKIIQSEEQMKQRTLVMGENGERTLVNRIIRHSGSQIQASNTRTIDDSNAMDDRSIDIKMESMGKNYGSMSDITTPTMVDISDYSHWMKVINMYMILWEKLQETNILPTVDDTMCHAIVSAVMQEMDNLEKTHPSKNGIDYNLRIRSLTQIKKLCRVMSMLTWIYTLLGTRLLDMNLDIKSIEGVFPEWSLSMLSILAYVSYIPSDAVFFTLTLYDACNLKSESVNVRVLKDIAAQTGFKSNWKKKCMAEVMKEITFYVEDNGYIDTKYVCLPPQPNVHEIYKIIWTFMKDPKPSMDEVKHIVTELTKLSIEASTYSYEDGEFENDPDAIASGTAKWKFVNFQTIRGAKIELVSQRGTKLYKLLVATQLLEQDFSLPSGNFKEAIRKVANHANATPGKLVTAYPLVVSTEDSEFGTKKEIIQEGVEVWNIVPDKDYHLRFTNPTALTKPQLVLLGDTYNSKKDHLLTNSSYICDRAPDKLSQWILCNSQGFSEDDVSKFDPIRLENMLRNLEHGDVPYSYKKYPEDILEDLKNLKNQKTKVSFGDFVKPEPIKSSLQNFEDILIEKKRDQRKRELTIEEREEEEENSLRKKNKSLKSITQTIS